MIVTFHKCHEASDTSITDHKNKYLLSHFTLLHLITNHRDTKELLRFTRK